MRAAGQARAMKRCVEPLAGSVARKDPARPVGAMGGWREAENEEAGAFTSETRDWTSPVFFIPERPPLFASNALPPLHQSRTRGTPNDVVADSLQLGARTSGSRIGRQSDPQLRGSREVRAHIRTPGANWAKTVGFGRAGRRSSSSPMPGEGEACPTSEERGASDRGDGSEPTGATKGQPVETS